MIEAIVYTSETGHTKEYAELLGKKTGLRVVPLCDAAVNDGSEIIYLGWLSAGKIKGAAKAGKKYTVRALCAVGMAPFSEEMESRLRGKNLKDNKTAFFYLQGGFDLQKLSGINKFIMSLLTKSIRQRLNAKESLSADDKLMLKMVNEGASTVHESNLDGIVQWYRTKAADR